MVLLCTSCSYCCDQSLNLLKHIFSAHSSEVNFRHVCGINGCLHSFKSGASFKSFTTHASRKHPNWHNSLASTLLSSPHNDLPFTSDNDGSMATSSEAAAVGSTKNLPDSRLATSPHSDLPFVSDPYDDGSMVISLEAAAAGSTENLPDSRLVTSTPTTSETVMTTTSTSSEMVDSQPTTERIAALFLLTFKEQHKLTQTSLNFAVGAINGIVDGVCSSIQHQVQNSLKNGGCSLDITDKFHYDDPFAGLQTEYQQSKFYQKEFGLIEPETVVLGATYCYQKSGGKRRLVEKQDTFQYVPLLKNLEWILQNEEIYAEVFRKRNRVTNFLSDVCDGSFFKEHPLFGHVDNALQLLIYYDDVESANPLGSYRGKHKLALFYYVLSNIEPRLRASLRSIQLIACVTYPNLQKYGFQSVLERFIVDVNKLAKGVTMKIGGKEQTVKGNVIFALADTLAAHNLGGFKSGVGFSLRKCRECLATYEQMSTKFRAIEFTPRTKETYNYHCSLLSGPLAAEDSTTYGVVQSSPLNLIQDFHVVDQLPQDIMHVLFEGVVPYELRLMLLYFFKEKYLTVSQLNEKIGSFCYSTHDAGDRPSEINPRIVTSTEVTINQSAAQMWVLSIHLPLIIGNKIPDEDEKWECFLLLLDIVKICTSRIVSESHVGYLEVLIATHHQQFIHCYSSARVIPKMHYMVHFPRQMLRTGPLICTWCMRMEGKNSYFKRVAQVSNFKNVPFTVAKRHQRLLCAQLQSSNFFNTAKDYGPLQQSTLADSEVAGLRTHLGDGYVTANKVAWVKWMGIKYHPKEFIIIGWQEDDLPKFGNILAIFASEAHEVYYRVVEYHTQGISRHFHSFVIEKTTTEKFVRDFIEYTPVRATQHDKIFYITLRSHLENNWVV